jgi:hypothetical protein
MGRLRGGGIYGGRDVAVALGVEPRELIAMVRSGDLPGAAAAKALEAHKRAKALDLSDFIRSATEIST